MLCNRTHYQGATMFNLAVVAANLVLWTHNAVIFAQHVI